MYLIPDLSTFQIYPWRPHQGRVARMVCDIRTADGEPFEGDPRYILKNTIQRALDMGYKLKVSSEVEFFLFHTDENGDPTIVTHDKAGYFDLGPLDLGENVRRDIVLTLQEMDFDIAASHHEVAPGQHEIDFQPEELLKAVDDIVTSRLVVKVVAQKHGLHATFMPKPIQSVNGSGMHTFIALCDLEGNNLFFDENDPYKLSPLAYCFMGGLIHHAKALTAVTNPTINSYKRLISGYEAPLHIGWSRSNMSPLVRIPVAKNKETYLEYRSPDSSCNPYLAMAAMVSAGLDGIVNKLSPGNEMTANELRSTFNSFEIEKSLPTTLRDALMHLEQDQVIRDSLGGVYSNFKRSKISEWEEYLTTVHDWEVTKYISKY